MIARQLAQTLKARSADLLIERDDGLALAEIKSGQTITSEVEISDKVYTRFGGKCTSVRRLKGIERYD